MRILSDKEIYNVNGGSGVIDEREVLRMAAAMARRASLLANIAQIVKTEKSSIRDIARNIY